MIFTLAWRALAANPVRSLVLGFGFGLGVSVMATLLGVAEVVLDQARAPELVGGGDVVITSATGPLTSARWLMSSVLSAAPLDRRIVAASPTSRAHLFLIRDGRSTPIRVRGGVPSLERAIRDPETSNVTAWIDLPADRQWSSPDPGDVLRAMDRFHEIPDVPARTESWAEWLYFNGHAGDTRFYLTFLVGPQRVGSRRAAGVRLQLDHAGRRTSYSQSAEVDEARVLAEAPDLTIGGSSVRLKGLSYHVTIDLPPSRIRGELVIDAVPGRALPPIAIHGAGGWVSGYTVPVMAGSLSGWLDISGARVSLDRGAAYHDHNWGFWRGVSWRWGQVRHGDLSLVYGRVHPPADAADPDRMPGFLGVLGPDGPLGYSTSVTIEEEDDPSTHRPRRILVRGRGDAFDLTMDLRIDDTLATRMGEDGFGAGMEFLQLRAHYDVKGVVSGRAIEFTAPGSAETFRPR